MQKRTSFVRFWMLSLPVFAWVGLVLQFYITLSQSMANGRTVGETISFYLSFFTILTNLLVALARLLQAWAHPRIALGLIHTLFSTSVP
jgi:hypothetical protein